MNKVFIAGATGYLGRHLCADSRARGWHVTALVRDATRAAGVAADKLVEAQATWPESLTGVMTGQDVVVSALGITRQADGLGYWDVDYQANINLLEEAEKSHVQRFGYVHVLNADQMSDVPLVAAKQAFVRRLRMSPVASTIIAPSGYFSDMADFFAMAEKGRVWLFGDGQQRINPIHGRDLAAASFDAIARNVDWIDVGGPDVLTHRELALMCFDTLRKPAKITYLPDALRRGALWGLPRFAPRHIAGPAQFFLTALGMNMTAPRFGTRHLSDHFDALAR